MSTQINISSRLPYKVFTALLTQSGGDNPEGISETQLVIGRTYRIDIGGDPSGNWDFTNVGAPNNHIGTYFIATGETPNNWGTNIVLFYNTGAPVVTVIENTIGNVWFTYIDVGFYQANSYGLFTGYKTTLSFMPEMYIESPADLYNFGGSQGNDDAVNIVSNYNNSPSDSRFGAFALNAIEIRVYN